MAEAAHHLAALLPADGSGLSWMDVVEDNELKGKWAPDGANLQGSVHRLLLDTYQDAGRLAAVVLIESASRLADLCHRKRTMDAELWLAQLEVHVRMLGVDHSGVMSHIQWAQDAPALVDASPDELWIAPFDLAPLRRMYDRLKVMKDRAKAGLKLERLLWRLLDLHRLRPTAGFRVEGQQLDGSFKLGGFVYILEAKWTGKKVSGKDLSWADKKVSDKSRHTRGVFISIAGSAGPP
jgi:hypothetical protein